MNRRKITLLAMTTLVCVALTVSIYATTSVQAQANGQSDVGQTVIKGESEYGYVDHVNASVSGTVEWSGFSDGVSHATVHAAPFTDYKPHYANKTVEIDSGPSGTAKIEMSEFRIVPGAAYSNQEEAYNLVDGTTNEATFPVVVVVTVHGENGQTASFVNEHEVTVRITNTMSENATASGETKVTGDVSMIPSDELSDSAKNAERMPSNASGGETSDGTA